ncbi:hypothetical protein, conserved [Trypanosoma brucei gambiense DAL972]|uniref:NB-ARC domain-containing protein n=1 Tax=Trypanosoma brucei gambiense (strain MHOM/CI/86/DAL972) TaxID=679716 RepID=C9ZHV1_TRYB9|nr:hypothetical protein, conserved [Trypanosoma brucei gambiense DAL972]CBH08822.1 hypothetical protein, conserved [Trypanosoma brucei gambiense DAL972]|eukprot:XP_011771263.1 hypothetical protein, conserved [Trypanosoma brucei gambiense DAL972]
MWRLLRRACVKKFPGGQTASTTFGCSVKRGATTIGMSDDPPAADPILFDAPVASRVVGREREIMQLWQNLLAGRHCQVIAGLDGIGKTTIAVEFCSRARRSGRFTCVHWFDWDDSLESHLLQFFQSMKGRKEKDVLLVVDGTPNPQVVLQLIPDHPNVYALVTSSADPVGNLKIPVLKAGSFTEVDADQFLQGINVEERATSSTRDVMHAVCRVPILMHLACCLMESGSVSPEELRSLLLAKGVGAEGTISVSHALNVFLDVALNELESHFPDGTKQLRTLAFFDVRNIPYAVVDSVVGSERGEEFVMFLTGLGICGQRWEDSSLFIHSCIADALLTGADDAILLRSAEVLQALWPRRWRSAGSSTAHELVRHTTALLKWFDARKLSLSNDLLLGLDRSATFLALNEGKELKKAAEFWIRVVNSDQHADRRTTEAVRVGRECGRLLHFLRDQRASSVLQYAYHLGVAVYGQQSPEAALILGCYAPYLPSSHETVQLLCQSAAALKNRLGCAEAVLGREEERMLLETVFVLYMCQGQMLQELGELVPDSLWESLQSVEKELKGGKHSKLE